MIFFSRLTKLKNDICAHFGHVIAITLRKSDCPPNDNSFVSESKLPANIVHIQDT